MIVWCKANGIDPRLYGAWVNMRTRCHNPRRQGYHNYGGRGITICSRWDKFFNFSTDMGPHPGKGWSLDRKKNHLGYGKSNCQWATRTMQNRNKRNIKLSEKIVGEIRQLFRGGVNQHNTGNANALASKFGVCRVTIEMVANRVIWK
jgi:hypothetical protein